MATSIAGAIFLILSIGWWLIQRMDEKKKKYEEAKRDKQKAIAAHDFNAQLDADRRMSLYK